MQRAINQYNVQNTRNEDTTVKYILFKDYYYFLRRKHEKNV